MKKKIFVAFAALALCALAVSCTRTEKKPDAKSDMLFEAAMTNNVV